MDTEKYIKEIIARKTARTQTTQVPGQEAHTVTVEQGQDALPPQSAAGIGQVDASMRGVNDSQSAKIHGPQVTQIEMPDSTPTEDDTITVGNVRIARNKAVGYELAFSKDQSSFYVYQDGKKVQPSNAIEVIFFALKAEGGGDATRVRAKADRLRGPSRSIPEEAERR